MFLLTKKGLAMKKNIVSIIVPIYNSEDFLERCLDSIMAQTYANIEVILVDDGSVDESFAICKVYEKKDVRWATLGMVSPRTMV